LSQRPHRGRRHHRCDRHSDAHHHGRIRPARARRHGRTHSRRMGSSGSQQQARWPATQGGRQGSSQGARTQSKGTDSTRHCQDDGSVTRHYLPLPISHHIGLSGPARPPDSLAGNGHTFEDEAPLGPLLRTRRHPHARAPMSEYFLRSRYSFEDGSSGLGLKSNLSFFARIWLALAGLVCSSRLSASAHSRVRSLSKCLSSGCLTARVTRRSRFRACRHSLSRCVCGLSALRILRPSAVPTVMRMVPTMNTITGQMKTTQGSTPGVGVGVDVTSSG
jgi:hypothetical protein